MGPRLYFHHAGGDYAARSRDPFPAIRDHVLLPFASALPDVDASMAGQLDERTLREILALVPDAWLAAIARSHPPMPAARLCGLSACAAGRAAPVRRGGAPCPVSE